MQPWDIVKVSDEGESQEFAGKAGVVLRVDQKKEIATVKLDEVPEQQLFAFSELIFLAR